MLKIKEIIYIFPIIILSYFIIEWFVHRYNSLAQYKKIGPFLGAIFASLPTCSTNVIASELFSQRIISMGTLLSVFVASNDEAMFLLLYKEKMSFQVLSLLGLKIIYAIVLGILVDRQIKTDIVELSYHSHAHSIFKHVLKHSIQVFVYILAGEFLVSMIISFINQEQLYYFFTQSKIFQPIVAGLIGLIPNCAGSILLVEGYTSGLISIGALFSGLSISTGLGIVTLFRLEKDIKNSLMVLGLLFFISVFIGYMVY